MLKSFLFTGKYLVIIIFLENIYLPVREKKRKKFGICYKYMSNFFSFVFREKIKRNFEARNYYVDVHIEHLDLYDRQFSDRLKETPADLLPLVNKIHLFLKKNY